MFKTQMGRFIISAGAHHPEAAFSILTLVVTYSPVLFFYKFDLPNLKAIIPFYCFLREPCKCAEIIQSKVQCPN